LLALKLALVAASVALSTLAARRWGHAIGGTVAGMPMIAAPIIAVLLIDQSAEAVRAIALATLVCLPGAILHIVTFARAGFRMAWPFALLAALAVYTLVGGALTWLHLPAWAVVLLALVAPSIGWWTAPRSAHAPGPVGVARIEFAMRLAAALGMAAAVILGADAMPAAISGLLLAVPINGTVLPCFTLPRHGADANASLLRGFVMGLHGFAAFFIALYLTLGVLEPALSFAVSLGAAMAAAALVQLVKRKMASRPW
jgi:hypothetical protein